jgi:hypothetical protein
LDFVWGSKLNDHFDVKFVANNILNPLVKFEQGKEGTAPLAEESNLITSYKRGIGFSMNLSYTF